MNLRDIYVKEVAKQLALKVRYIPTPLKPWKELSGLEWTERLLNEEHEKEKTEK